MYRQGYPVPVVPKAHGVSPTAVVGVVPARQVVSIVPPKGSAPIGLPVRVVPSSAAGTPLLVVTSTAAAALRLQAAADAGSSPLASVSLVTSPQSSPTVSPAASAVASAVTADLGGAAAPQPQPQPQAQQQQQQQQALAVVPRQVFHHARSRSEGWQIGAAAAVVVAANCVSPVLTTARQPRQSLSTLSAAAVAKVAAGTAPVEVAIQGRTFILGEVLGKGSFGTVWKAREVGGSQLEVAVKEICCRSDKERTQAEYEASLMRRLSTERIRPCPAEADERQRIACPMLHASQTVVDGLGQWKVTIAMDRVGGIPLDEYAREDKNKQSFWDAASLSRQLLEQLCPTLEHVAPHCVHRDINAHNIMLAARCGKENQDHVFTLIDFGLAADTVSWRSGDWKTKDIGGDCRYWPVSCWKLFLFGYKYLQGSQQLTNEYIFGLDQRSLVLTCVQLLVEVARCQFPEGTEGLEKAWTAYWDDAMRFWKQLYACFKQKGEWNALKSAFLQQQVAETTGRNLAGLRSALSACATVAAARTPPIASTGASVTAAADSQQLAGFFRTLGRMLDGDVVDWAELRRLLAAPVVPPSSAPLAGGTSPQAQANFSLADSPAAAPFRRFSHQRVRTLDGASSITRDVPEVGAVRVCAEVDSSAATSWSTSSPERSPPSVAMQSRRHSVNGLVQAQHVQALGACASSASSVAHVGQVCDLYPSAPSFDALGVTIRSPNRPSLAQPKHLLRKVTEEAGDLVKYLDTGED
mmetsp:Transcript_49124/g.158676  ORF Transcript_49124/g.158676 Transcript_49124/m.158676 type:complete len:752 (+) Transcript_49124:97-2352(+)